MAKKGLFICKCKEQVQLPGAYLEKDTFGQAAYFLHEGQGCNTLMLVYQGTVFAFKDAGSVVTVVPGACPVCEKDHLIELLDAGQEGGQPYADYRCVITGKTFTHILSSK